MLQQLRDKSKSFVSSTLLILLVFSFGIWGIGDIFRGGFSKDWVVKVGDAKLSASVLKREFENEVTQMRGLLGPDFTNQKAKEMGLLERSIDKLVALTTVNLETNRLGYNIPKTEIIRTLETTPQLRNPDGTFNKQMFGQLLATQGMNEAMFIDAQKQIAARNIIVRSLSAATTTPDLLVNDIAAGYAQKRVAETILVNPKSINIAPTTDEAILKKYYDEDKDNYKAQETRSFDVLTLTPQDASKDVHVSAEDAQKFYDEHKAEYEIPEKRTLLQVVVSDEAKAKDIATNANPSTLKSVAKSNGEDAVAIDDITRNDLPPEYGEAVYAAPIGKLSGPVQSNLGWHVFVVQKVTPMKSKTFAEAKDQLIEQMKKDQAAEHMVQIANKVDDMLAANKPLQEIASAHGLVVAKFENLDKSGDNAKIEIPFKNEVLKAAFQYNEGESSPLLESKSGGYALVHINKVTPSHVLEFDAVKDRVKQDWVQHEKVKKAIETAEAISKTLKEGKPLSSITGEGLAKKTSSPIMVDEKTQKDIPREAMAPLFDLKKGDVAVVTTADGTLVIRVKDIIAGHADEIEVRKKQLKSKLEQEAVATHLDAYTAALRQAYPVEMDKAGLDRLIGTNDSAM